jgi:predicted transcriptional regulator
MPIKPVFVKRILAGEKKWEFRKKLPAQKFDKIIVYSSSPEKKIRAIVHVSEIKSGKVNEIWELTKEHAGINHDDFIKYFSNNEVAYAIKIDSVIKTYASSPVQFGIKVPQAFTYVLDEAYKKILKTVQMRYFIGGIHGSGKTTLLNMLKNMGFSGACVTCSQIANYSGSRVSVNDFVNNQIVINERLDSDYCQYKSLVIDGHFSLLLSNSVECLDKEIFRTMGIQKAYVLSVDEKTAQQRIKSKGEFVSLERLRKFQKKEIFNAQRISTEIGINCIVTSNVDDILYDIMA